MEWAARFCLLLYYFYFRKSDILNKIFSIFKNNNYHNLINGMISERTMSPERALKNNRIYQCYILETFKKVNVLRKINLHICYEKTIRESFVLDSTYGDVTYTV